jgi:hypothetical protein
MKVVAHLRWRIGSSLLAREARRNRERARAAMKRIVEVNLDDEPLVVAGLAVFGATLVGMSYCLWCATQETCTW